jgi:hypothetical protein
MDPSRVLERVRCQFVLCYSIGTASRAAFSQKPDTTMPKDMGKPLSDPCEPGLIGDPVLSHRVSADGAPSPRAVWLAAGRGGHLLQGTTHTVSSLTEPGRLK